METTEKMGVMSALRNRKGFSLVEMAVVLVIIGIIIGAVMKGQDLITNSRAKQVSTAVDTWRALALAFMDRNGRLPGDTARDGVIGKAFGPYSTSLSAEGSLANSAVKEIQNTMINAPTNPVVIGSLKFYVYFGNVPGLPTGTSRNVMTICKDSACAIAFTLDEVEILKAIDTAFDGNADAGRGQFRGVVTANTITGTPATYSVVRDIANFVNYSVATNTSKEWGTTTVAGVFSCPFKAAVWAFDRPF